MGAGFAFGLAMVSRISSPQSHLHQPLIQEPNVKPLLEGEERSFPSCRLLPCEILPDKVVASPASESSLRFTAARILLATEAECQVSFPLCSSTWVPEIYLIRDRVFRMVCMWLPSYVVNSVTSRRDPGSNPWPCWGLYAVSMCQLSISILRPINSPMKLVFAAKGCAACSKGGVGVLFSTPTSKPL